MKMPFYMRADRAGFIAYPLHYVLFSQRAWYRWLIGGPWDFVEYGDKSGGIWVRMRPEENA